MVAVVGAVEAVVVLHKKIGLILSRFFLKDMKGIQPVAWAIPISPSSCIVKGNILNCRNF